jgi:hypothetical protein
MGFNAATCALQLVASLDFQVNVVACPAVMEVGVADSVTAVSLYSAGRPVTHA